MDAALVGRIEAEEVEDEAADDGQIGAGVFGSGAHLVIVECDIEAPMDAVLDCPMIPDGIGQHRRVGGDAADVQAAFKAGLAVDCAF